jgi:NADH dehydrogenase FAD-containing subunit
VQRMWQQLKASSGQLYGVLSCRFVSRFTDLLSRAAASRDPLTLAVVGGGAGGLELALALAYRMQQERAKPGAPHPEQPDTVQ